MNQSRAARFWVGLCSVAMVAAPLFQAIGMSARPRSASVEWVLANPGANLLYIVAELLAGLFYIPAFAGLVRLIGDRSRWLGYIGGLLALLGVIGFTMLNTLLLGHHILIQGGEAGIAAATALEGSLTVGIAMLLFLPGMVLGLLLLSIGVWRDQRALRPAVGIVWLFIALDMAAPPQVLGFDLPHFVLLVGLGWIALRSGAQQGQAMGAPVQA